MTDGDDFTTANDDSKICLNPFFFLYGHVQGNSFGIVEALFLNLAIKNTEALLCPDCMQHALFASRTTRGAEFGWENGR